MAQQPKKSALSWKLKAILALAAAVLCGRIFVEAIDSLSGQQSLVDLIATIAVVLFLAVSAVGLNKFFKSYDACQVCCGHQVKGAGREG